MQEDNKKEFSIEEGKHFIFTIGQSHHYRARTLPYLLRTGVKWQSLLGTLISVPELKKAFWGEWTKVLKRYPRMRNSHRYKIINRELMPTYNFIAPEWSWIEEFHIERLSFIQDFIPRFQQLLIEQILPCWIVVQIIPPLLDKITKKLSKKDAIDLGRRFLKATIEAFQSTRQEGYVFYKFENFYSFIFNLLQESFTSNGLRISVSKTLVYYQVSVTFLKDVYAQHPNNFAARKDLWKWFTQDKDFFGDDFDKYWLDRGYTASEIESFKKVVIPVFPPDEEFEDMLKPSYTLRAQAPVFTPAGWGSTSSPAESLTSDSSYSSYSYQPPDSMYLAPIFQLTPPHVSLYQVSMPAPDFMLGLVSSLSRAPIEDSKLNLIPTTTILETMQESYSSNQQGFLVGRSKEKQGRSNLGDLYQHRI